MKKIVTSYGLISGAISATWMAIGMAMLKSNPEREGSMIMGFASMIISFSLIFVAVKTYRDKHNNGIISFGMAFKIGALIALIASTIYVATWAVEYNFYMPDYLEQYTAQTMKAAEAENKLNKQQMIEKLAEMNKYKDMYHNPVLFTLLTYAEILPVGLIVSVISALILKRKNIER